MSGLWTNERAGGRGQGRGLAPGFKLERRTVNGNAERGGVVRLRGWEAVLGSQRRLLDPRQRRLRLVRIAEPGRWTFPATGCRGDPRSFPRPLRVDPRFLPCQAIAFKVNLSVRARCRGPGRPYPCRSQCHFPSGQASERTELSLPAWKRGRVPGEDELPGTPVARW